MTTAVDAAWQVDATSTGLHSDAGYGVMPDIEHWPWKVGQFVDWLRDPVQCPTANPFILSERRRMNRIEAQAARRPQYAAH